MGTWDYILILGSVLVFVFTIVMDVLLVVQWIKKRGDRLNCITMLVSAMLLRPGRC